MAKYLIQDIIPKNRQRNTTGDHRTPPHSMEDMKREKPQERAIHHDHGKTVRLRSRSHPETANVRGEISHEDEHSIRATPHIHKNPKSIIADSLAGEVIQENNDQARYFDETISDDPAVLHAKRMRTQHIAPNDFDIQMNNKDSFWKNWTPWIVGAFLCALGVIVTMNFFGGATIVVSPKKESIPMDLSLTAVKKTSADDLTFSVMKVSLDQSIEVPATGEKTVTTKAKGTIIIYNKQTVTQRLIKNTRFQSPSGKIYRINDSVNVPKAVTTSGKLVPGSLEVIVYADEAGPDYNTEATDFTVPGLKGSPTFDKVYARGKGAITGGASGTIKSVSDLDLKNASDELRVQLETKLRLKAHGDIAPSQISFDKGIVVELNPAELSKEEASSKDKAVVVQSGTLYMVTFDRDLLTKILTTKLIQTYKGETVLISNLDSSEFDMPKITGQQLWSLDKLDFTLKGMPNLEWSFDEKEIKKAIAGAPRQNFNMIMTQFPTIDLAKATISPIWKRSFPVNEDKITIKTEVSVEEK